jgi:RNA polymerase sigma-70 factor (ECF subfamily)
MSQTTSTTLLEKLRNHADHDAWGEFHAIYEPLLNQWLHARRVPAKDIPDLRQDVFAVLTAELSRFVHNGRKGAFRTWLRRIATNRLRTWVRQQRRNPHSFDAGTGDLGRDLQDDFSGASKLSDNEHDAFLLGRLLAAVSDRFRPHSLAAFRAVVLDGRKVKDVAAELGMTENAVRIAQTRVLAALRAVAPPLLDE